MTTSDPTIPEPPAAQNLSEVDRAFLTLFVTAPGTLSSIAEETGLDLLTIAEKFLSPEIQAALATIEKAAAQLSRIHALLARPTAINTLADVAADSKLNPTERRRAGSALLRAAPIRSSSRPGYPDAPRRVRPAQEPIPTPVAGAPPNQAHAPEPITPPPIAQASPAPEPRAESPTTPELATLPTPPAPTSTTEVLSTSPPPRSRDRPPKPTPRQLTLARKPPLIAAA